MTKARRSGLAVATATVLGTLAACSSVPDPGGARFRGEVADVRSDGDEAFVASWAAFAETRYWQLAHTFGFRPNTRFGVALCTQAASFERLCRELGKDPDEREAFFHWGKTWGDEPSVVATIGTSTSLDSARIVTHELVHFFGGWTWPEAPHWFQEGLAMELSHSNQRLENGRSALADEDEIAAIVSEQGSGALPLEAARARVREVRERQSALKARDSSGRDAGVAERCPALVVHGWSRPEVERELGVLEAFEASSGVPRWRSYLLAGAVVRFLMETQDPQRLTDLRPELPKAGELAAWLEALTVPGLEKLHDRFPPAAEDEPEHPR